MENGGSGRRSCSSEEGGGEILEDTNISHISRAGNFDELSVCTRV